MTCKAAKDCLMNDVEFTKHIGDIAEQRISEDAWKKAGKAGLGYLVYILSRHYEGLAHAIKEILQ